MTTSAKFSSFLVYIISVIEWTANPHRSKWPSSLHYRTLFLLSSEIIIPSVELCEQVPVPEDYMVFLHWKSLVFGQICCSYLQM